VAHHSRQCTQPCKEKERADSQSSWEEGAGVGVLRPSFEVPGGRYLHNPVVSPDLTCQALLQITLDQAKLKATLKVMRIYQLLSTVKQNVPQVSSLTLGWERLPLSLFQTGILPEVLPCTGSPGFWGS
jgi:hypothetical protein